MKTQMEQLLDLCAAAVAATADQRRQAEQAMDDETLHAADQLAAKTFGEQAADAFGEWILVDVPEPDLRQAFATIADQTHLQFTINTDGDTWFDLLSYCPRCSNFRQVRVGSLDGLGIALADAGVLR